MAHLRVALISVIAIAAVACSAPGPSPTAAPTATPGVSPTVAPGAVVDHLEAAIPVTGRPDWPTAAFGSIWVLAPDQPLLDSSATPNLVRIDPATNEVLATIALSDRQCQGFVATDDAIWVCAADALIKVDPGSNAIVDSVPVNGVGGAYAYRPAYGAGVAWFLGNGSFRGDTVIALDPSTKRTTSYPAGGSVFSMTFAFDALWLTVPGKGAVVRLDPATGETRELVTGLPAPAAIVAGEDALWVALYGGEDAPSAGDPQLARIDPASGEVVAELAVGQAPKYGLDLWAGDSSVLVRGTRPWLTRIDAATNTIVNSLISEPDISAVQGPLTVAFGSIWTVNIELEEMVYRIAP